MSQNYETLLLNGDEAVSQAVQLLQQGECVALPTETVYGLAANAANAPAVDKIFAAKGRPKNHPLIVHIPDVSHLEKWAADIPATAYALAEQFWPGPLTLLLKKAPHVDDVVTGGLDTIALRVPAHPLFLSVLAQLDSGLAAPSANRYKQLSPTIAEQVSKGLKGRIAAVLDGGPCAHGLESTILDLVSERPRILRAGPITKQQLDVALGCDVEMPKQHVEVVPGNVKAHYQPITPARLVTTEQLVADMAELQGQNVCLLLWSEQAIAQAKATGLTASQWREMPREAALYGQQLYVTLYQVDQLDVANILVELPPQSDDWRAINDRLSRAASY
ncbi:L-threonylcarbamoyladenylate synthase [Motilimonas sp. 1_MG-2023]|uniref:L-threonylcarbamoyladenylate synthase n=1 Tax=Motilimonas TaxID=1914248 RepID=UPI0026E11AB4|nr:L-threonylcarbamoyladenylate synthase [Motilimonas sp. 1_MG-2023]MDO6525332.1 L-threonylcarbamoyladenylate synthase [Motilimonas sp. 1_MG-2023]